MNCFYRFLEEINKTIVQILDLPSEELDQAKRRIQRFLSDSGSKMNILKDDEFAKSEFTKSAGSQA